MSLILDGTNGATSPAGIAVGNATVQTGGIAFPATAVAVADVNTLDDYEEGTWTPTLVGSSVSGTQTYGGNTLGVYTKIGRLVTINFVITLATKGTISGNISV